MIQYVPPEGLNKVWEFYRQGILEIISFGGVTFIPEDVYLNLKTGKAALYRVGDDGFFVAEKCIETLSGDPFLNIWLMWFRPGHGLPHKQRLLDFIDGLERSLGCLWTDFGSTREAWIHLLDGDFKKHMVTLRRVR